MHGQTQPIEVSAGRSCGAAPATHLGHFWQIGRYVPVMMVYPAPATWTYRVPRDNQVHRDHLEIVRAEVKALERAQHPVHGFV